MIYFNKLFCQLDDTLNFDSQLRQIFGIGINNNIYKKFISWVNNWIIFIYNYFKK